ncbi:MAG: Crp/Fnr family transcriptional regulator [Gammaproteobacteria bacterium]|nr:Crp/Fnr family transcriptional regulator [Gammaproteobacteria bacterium]
MRTDGPGPAGAKGGRLSTEIAPEPRAPAGASPCAGCGLRRLPPCEAVPPDQLEHLAAARCMVTLDRRQALFFEGEPARHVFLLTAGTIMISKLTFDGRRQVVGFLFAGDFLGFAHDDAYTYGAEALSGATLCRFRREGFEALMARFPAMAAHLLRLANHELTSAQDQMLLLGRKTAREKLASFLLVLSERAGRSARAQDVLFLAMPRCDIADYLGLSAETVSRALRSLAEDRLIRVCSTQRVQILDREGLVHCASCGGPAPLRATG